MVQEIHLTFTSKGVYCQYFYFLSGDSLNWNWNWKGSKLTPTGVLNLPTSRNSSPTNGQIWYDNSSIPLNFIKMVQYQLYQVLQSL